MHRLALLLVVLVPLAGCLGGSTPADVTDAPDDPAPTYRMEWTNETRSGTVTGAHTPLGDLNMGGSDTVQSVTVKEDVSRMHVHVVAEGGEVRVGFDCQEGETISCQEWKTTEDGHLHHDISAPSAGTYKLSFWYGEMGAGEASYEAEIGQLRNVTASG